MVNQQTDLKSEVEVSGGSRKSVPKAPKGSLCEMPSAKSEIFGLILMGWMVRGLMVSWQKRECSIMCVS